MHSAVETLLRNAADSLILPRWQKLQAGDAMEKSPGEWVTVVDREVEEMVTDGLLQLIPGSSVVGEEQSVNETDYFARWGHGAVWLVDPLDGTGNFIAGKPPISLMVALLEQGTAIASWMLDPLTGTMHRAIRNGGAWRNDRRIHMPAESMELRRGIVKTRFLPANFKAAMTAAAASLEIQSGSNCAGADYPDIVAGASDFALYWRTLPWDHAPGALFLTEAGGHVARLDGSAYRPGVHGEGLLAARSRLLWEQARSALTPASPYS